jgi:predicted dehydrogenase
MQRNLGIGVIGCGNIATTYLRLAPLFRGIEMRGCADIDENVAAAKAKEYGIRADSVAALLAADDIDIIVNLTIPAAHYEVSRAILEAGKHVYSEKPYVLSVEEGLELADLARKKGLRIGSAPDTFLGGAHQHGRHIVDSGLIGRITSGTAHVMSHGMEHWHPNPDFFFQPGGGPILDLGPYYLADLVQLAGPVRQVAAMTSIPARQRTITSEPRKGQTIEVNTPTTIHALLEFENGAVFTLNTSWDVWNHGHAPLEIYGEEGSLFLPDPNFFGGEVRFTRQAEAAAPSEPWDHPFGVVNQDPGGRNLANYRAVGLADMALAIMEDRPHRCSGEFALHVVDIMTGILRSGETGRFEAMRTTCDRPAALSPKEALDLSLPVADEKVA